MEAAVNDIPGSTIIQYLDVTLTKTVGENQEKVTKTNSPITIVFVIPEDMRGEGRTYSAIRVHNGETSD